MERVDLSIPLLTYWHNRLNRELFKGALRRISVLHGLTHPAIAEPVYGYYQPDDQLPYINIDARVTTRAMLLNTLTHEMVHQYQDESGLPLTHGKVFQRHAKRMAKHGIIL